MGIAFYFYKMKWVLEIDLHNNVNVLNTTELYTLDWLLRWQILCFVYFTTIKILNIYK